MTFQSAQSTKSRYSAQALKRMVVHALLLAGISGGVCALASTPTTTTLALTSGGTAVTLSATVKAGGSPAAVGRVKFCDAAAARCEDLAVLGTAQLTATGKAKLNIRTLDVSLKCGEITRVDW